MRFAAHLVAIAVMVALEALAIEHHAPLVVQLLATTALGFTLVTMFAAMHESVHRTAFKSRALNDAVGFLAGVLSFYNSTYYRPYHAWHHRFTQIPGRDPELDDRKPTSVGSYLLELSAVPWWLGKLKTYLTLALGRTHAYPFLDARTGPLAVRSVRAQLALYVGVIGVSLALGQPYFVSYWLAPVALAQPLLRAILLAEHTGCSQDDDALGNTRTTYTLWPVRFLMWEMPYHAEHHRYPALPFFSLAPAHTRLGPHLAHVARRGYSGFHRELVQSFASAPRSERQA